MQRYSTTSYNYLEAEARRKTENLNNLYNIIKGERTNISELAKEMSEVIDFNIQNQKINKKRDRNGQLIYRDILKELVEILNRVLLIIPVICRYKFNNVGEIEKFSYEFIQNLNKSCLDNFKQDYYLSLNQPGFRSLSDSDHKPGLAFHFVRKSERSVALR